MDRLAALHKKSPQYIQKLLNLRRIAVVEFSPVFQGRDQSSVSLVAVALATLEMGINRR